MQIEAIRLPQVAYPAPGSEAGTPVQPREPIPFGAVMPAPVLPEEGAKTRDRHANPQKPDRAENEEEQEQADTLPEPFKLIFAKDFATILRHLSVDRHGERFMTALKMREERDVYSFRGYPPYYIDTPMKADSICVQYEQSVFYYHTRPGARFTGRM